LTPLTSQINQGPFSINVTSRFLRARVHGTIGFQTTSLTIPFFRANDILWGLQWVPSGNSPEDILISAPDEHWFWRHVAAGNEDVTVAFSVGSGTVTYETLLSTTQEYHGQTIGSVGNIDIYLSIRSIFGVTTANAVAIGNIEARWD
jgi:hypothetical protein